jgi:hypothetical protein
MTYSIIPPTLVVVSLIGIILFLMKKAPHLVELSEREERRNLIEEENQNLLKKTVNRIKEGRESKLKHRFLSLLEKVTRRFKVLFLKLENTFTHWNESIRKKRKDHLIERGESLERKDTKSILEKMKEHRLDREREGRIEVKQEGIESVVVRERYSRPMISEKIVNPRSKRVEMKNHLEKILIERIAANPKDTEAYERLGEYYFEIENLNHAKECFKQVIKLNPANEEAKIRMKKLERLLAR